MAWVSLCDLSQLVEGQGMYAEIDGFHLAVFLHEGKVFALDNSCPHAGASLAGGWIDEGHVVCPLHAWSFRLDNGMMRNSVSCQVTSYPTRLYERPDRPPLVQAELPTP